MSVSLNNNPNSTSTIAEFITFKDENTFSYHNMSFRDEYDNISYPIKNIIDDYKDELMELVLTDITLSESEYLKYRYKPRLLANDIYDNPDLDFIILAINGVCNMKEFNSRTIKLIKLTELNNFLTTIFNANKEYIDLYNANSNA